MVEIDVPRERVYLKDQPDLSPKPFSIGEQLSGIYPHEGPKGAQHKGNFIIVEVVGGNELGFEAKARCANRPCTVEVKVFGI